MRVAAAAVISVLLTGSLPLQSQATAPVAQDGDSSIVREVLDLAERLYVQKERIEPLAFMTAALSSLEKKYPAIIVDLQKGGLEAVLKIDGQNKSFHLNELHNASSAATVLEKALNFVSSRIRDVEVHELRYTALRGGLATLDPHTQLFDRGQIGDFQTRTRGSFGGVGFSFTISGDGILVDEILPRTPAEKVDLRAGDLIAAIDGSPTAGISTGEAVDLVRGEPGTEVVLTITREGWSTSRDLTPVRSVIQSRSVRSEVFTDEGEVPVSYIKIARFQEETALQIHEAIESAGGGVAGIILDLRGNPGGLLDQAVSSTDIFLDSGVILSTRDRSGSPKVHQASMFGIVREQLPLVVLINRMSASASEVMAAALKESRAVVLGERSFGKGSVQQLYPLSDGGGLLLTIRHYFTPGEVSIQSMGVVPDIVLRPVVAGEKVFMGEPPVHRREGSLRNAFSHQGDTPARGEPVWRLEYLRESVPEIFTPKGAGSEEGRGHGLRKQIAVETAVAILRRAAAEGRGSSRTELLEVTGPVLEEVGAAQASRIREALSARGIEWEQAPGAEGPRPLLEAGLPGKLILEAGATSGVTAQVRNVGQVTAYRVWGRSSSGNPFLSNLDFVFGTIPPGTARKVTVDLPVPSWARQRWDNWELALEEGDGMKAGTFRGVARTSAGTPPSVAYSVSLADGDGDDPGRSGDGVLEEGERLTVHVRAAGEAKDLDLRVTPRLPGKVSIDRREVSLHAVEGNATEGSFGVRLTDAEGLDALQLDLAFRSGSFGLVMKDSLVIPVGSPYRKTVNRTPPLVTAVEPPPERTESGSITLRLDVTDEEAVRDVYVRIGGKKIFYLRAADPGSLSLPVELEIALAGGSNRIDVVARDRDGLVTERTFFVFRLPG